MPVYANMAARIVAQVRLTATGCAEWQGNLNNRGYARLTVRCCGKVRKVFAHRVSHEVFKGAVPAGYEVDHKCVNPRCVNPEHLEAVTPKENQRRKYARRAQHAGE